MVTSFSLTAARLWRTAPAWKITVLAAGLCTIMALLHTLSGGTGTSSTGLSPTGSGTSPSASAPFLPSDPASDLRLAAFEAARDTAAKVAEPGQRCEQIMAAYTKLTAEDRTRGRDVRAASKVRLAALSEGERCRASLQVSDQHFDGFERAVAAAETSRAPDAMTAAAGAGAALDDFDRSRSRYASEAALRVKAKEFGDTIAASDARITALLRATETFAGDRSGAAHIQLAAAAKNLTDFDRGRLTPAQRASFDVANQAAVTVSDGRGRLAKLFPLMTTIEHGQTPENVRRLVEATAAITPFDEEIATPEQKATLDKARAIAKPLSLALLQDRVNALTQPESPSTVQAVADIYRLVKDMPIADLSDRERAALAAGQGATDTLTASDDRLGALLVAADQWRRRNGTEGRGILTALKAITPFDQARFQDQHKAAWETASRASAIILGPQRGLTAATKAQIPIFIFSSGQSSLDRDVANALRTGLRGRGFQIANSRNDAALLVDVSIDRVDDPAMDTSGDRIAWKVTAHLALNAVWAVDDSTLLNGPVLEIGQDQDRDEAKRAALRAAVAAVEQKFDQLAGN
jgi:hypothetical protein